MKTTIKDILSLEQRREVLEILRSAQSDEKARATIIGYLNMDLERLTSLGAPPAFLAGEFITRRPKILEDLKAKLQSPRGTQVTPIGVIR